MTLIMINNNNIKIINKIIFMIIILVCIYYIDVLKIYLHK